MTDLSKDFNECPKFYDSANRCLRLNLKYGFVINFCYFHSSYRVIINAQHVSQRVRILKTNLLEAIAAFQPFSQYRQLMPTQRPAYRARQAT